MLHFFYLKQTEIIGEAAFKLEAAVRAAHSSVPWKQIMGMRHILVHDYFDVDWETLWVVLTREIDSLHERISAIVESLGD